MSTIRLIDVYAEFEVACVVLFQLLRQRRPQESISHKVMPEWEAHCAFVASRPYAAWYLIEGDGLYRGAVYLSKQREIGIGVLLAARKRGYAEAAIRELMRRHPGRFLANINPMNEASIWLFQKLGFSAEPIQITYAKEPA